MVVVVLIVFLISEGPRVCLFVLCCIIILSRSTVWSSHEYSYYLLILIVHPKIGMTDLIVFEYGVFGGYIYTREKWDLIKYSVESIKMF